MFVLYSISSYDNLLLNLGDIYNDISQSCQSGFAFALCSSHYTPGTFAISICFSVTPICRVIVQRSAKAYRMNVTEALPDHSNIIDKIKLGTIAVSFNFILTSPFVFFMVFIFIIRGLMSGQDTLSFLQFAMNPPVFAGFIAMMLLLGAYLFVVNTFMVPIFMYRYISTHSFTQSLRLDEFINVLRISWLDWIIVFLFSIMLTSFSRNHVVLC